MIVFFFDFINQQQFKNREGIIWYVQNIRRWKVVSSELVDFIKNFVTSKFGDDLISVFGIGSAFESNVKARDVDIIVVLDNLDKCPSYDWTPARFESKTITFDDESFDVWFLYNTIEGYTDKKVFESLSFANWEWSVRGLKYASTLIMGVDFRDRLPEPPYDYDDILIRCAYHLEPSTQWKLRKVAQEGKKPMEYERDRFTKGIFKFGFLLVAFLYPEENAFSKEDVYNKLLDAYRDDKIDGRILDFYDLAIDYRSGVSMPDFESLRREFAKLMVKESIYVLGKLWSDIERLFKRAFGKKAFSNLLSIIRQEGWE